MKLDSYLKGIKSMRLFVVNTRTNEVLHKVLDTDKYTWVGSLVATSTSTPVTFFSEKEAEKIASKNVVHDSFYYADRDGLVRNMYNQDGTKK